MSFSDQITNYLDEVSSLLYSMPRQPIQDILNAVLTAYKYGRTIYIIGNGGSASTASHFAFDLQRWTIPAGKPRLKAIALTDNIALVSAWARNGDYDRVFEEQLQALLNPGDVVVAFCENGRVPCIIAAIRFASTHGAITVGLSGYKGGELLGLADHCVVVPCEHVFQIEDMHLMVCHLIVDGVHNALEEVAASVAPHDAASVDSGPGLP